MILEEIYKQNLNIEHKFKYKKILFIGSESYDAATITIIEGLYKLGFEILVYKKLNINSWFCETIISNLEIKFIEALRILKFVNSNGEARRLIKGNGAKINDIVINDENYSLSKEDFNNGYVKISSGKKKHGLLIKK